MDNEEIYIGLGSNIEDRYLNMEKGINLINSHPHIWVTKKSKVYQSPPLYNHNQNFFYNMVIMIETNLLPIDLLKFLQKIETKIGRKKTNKKNMPRELDLDLLAYGNIEINTKILTLPHPKIKERKFVLKPWNDIAPDFYLKKYSNNISNLLLLTSDHSKINMVLILENN